MKNYFLKTMLLISITGSSAFGASNVPSDAELVAPADGTLCNICTEYNHLLMRYLLESGLLGANCGDIEKDMDYQTYRGKVIESFTYDLESMGYPTETVNRFANNAIGMSGAVCNGVHVGIICQELNFCQCVAGAYNIYAVGETEYDQYLVCVKCPDGGTSAANTKNGINACYIPAGGTFNDSTGSGVMDANCYWSN